LEAETDAGKLLWEAGAKALLKLGDAEFRGLFDLDLKHALARAAAPEVDGVDRVGRALHADPSDADGDVVRSDLSCDDVQRLAGDLFGGFDARSRGSAEAQLELAGIDDGEDLAAQSAADKDNNQARDKQIHAGNCPAPRQEALGQCGISSTEPIKGTMRCVGIVFFLQHPDR